MTPAQPAALLHELLAAAIAAADPRRHMAARLPAPPAGRVVVVGAGKASAAMAEAVEAAWPDADLCGAVAVPPSTRASTRRIELIEAGHPIPDDSSVAAARRMRALVADLGADDLVVALVSGGGSALLCEPAADLALAQKQEITRALLASGASIHEINAVRQRLSAIKGGRLALAAAPAPVCTLLVSDIPGDDPALVASGPTIASPFDPGEAAAVIARRGIELPARARALLADNRPPSAEDLGERCRHTVLCSAMQSLDAATEGVRAAGLAPLVLGDGLEGEARAMGTVHAGIAHSVRRWHQPAAPPAVLLSGGEATVTLGDAGGRGGRNTEFLLALAIALDGAPGIHALAADTDGIDGSEDNAGAVIGPDTLARARALGVDPHDALARHDAYGFFEALGDLVDTGPTGTNVNDFRAIVIE